MIDSYHVLHCPKCGAKAEPALEDTQYGPRRGELVCSSGKCGEVWALTVWANGGLEMRLRLPGLIS